MHLIIFIFPSTICTCIMPPHIYNFLDHASILQWPYTLYDPIHQHIKIFTIRGMSEGLPTRLFCLLMVFPFLGACMLILAVAIGPIWWFFTRWFGTFFDFFPDMVGFVLGGQGQGYLLSDDTAFLVGCWTHLDFCLGMGATTEELLR